MDKIRQPTPKSPKKKHVHYLTHESLIRRMDAYALKRGVTKVAVFEAAMTEYLNRKIFAGTPVCVSDLFTGI